LLLSTVTSANCGWIASSAIPQLFGIRSKRRLSLANLLFPVVAQLRRFQKRSMCTRCVH